MGKKLGQHFLHEKGVLAKIANEVAGKSALEIGGGTGNLTAHIVNKVKKLYVVETDRALVPGLKEKFPTVKVIEGDFLKLEPFKVDVIVSNVPYYISSPILFKLYDWQFDYAVLMFQKEFVDKMLAKSGTKAYSRLSVNAQDCYEIKKLFDVGRGAFSPPPKVDSTVIRITKKKRQLEGADELIIKLFSQKNKKVRNSVKAPTHLADKRPWQLTIDEMKELIELN